MSSEVFHADVNEDVFELLQSVINQLPLKFHVVYQYLLRLSKQTVDLGFYVFC